MKVLLVLIGLFVAGCTSAPLDPPQVATDFPDVLGPPYGATRLSTSEPLDHLEKSVSLRQRYQVAIPTGERVIYIESTATHHTSAMQSTVAFRSPDGVWSISKVGEESAGLIRMEPKFIPETVRTLSPQEGAVLDRLLASRDVYSGNLISTGRVGVGSAIHVMEIVGPRGRTVIEWMGKLEGQPGQIADILLGSGE